MSTSGIPKEYLINFLIKLLLKILQKSGVMHLPPALPPERDQNAHVLFFVFGVPYFVLGVRYLYMQGFFLAPEEKEERKIEIEIDR